MAPRIPKRNARFIDSDTEANRGRAAFEMLRGYAGAPSQASVMTPGALSAYENGELAGMAEMLIPGASLAKGALGAALAGVVKSRGGNWMKDSVEKSMEKLLPLPRGYSERMEVPDRGTVRYISRDPNLGIREVREYLQETAPQQEALQRWIEGPLTKYIKRDMATPEDPVRRLAEEGTTHFGFPEGVYLPAGIQAARDAAGFPKKGLATSRAARSWETLADFAANPMEASEYAQNPRLLAENPWLSKLDPEAHVYGMPRGSQVELGFDHLVDELSNAMDPESGLPRNLLLRPEQMQQMGMEKAVRHVDAINKWRAAQQTAANAELANKAMVIREYAENNPKGLRWVELKAGDPDENMLSSLSPSDRSRYERYLEKGDSPVEAMRAAMGDDNPIVKALEKQLKYEGDTMGHCVGGYCDEVIAGHSRIFSLRDAKGEPHVTIEVGNTNANVIDPDEFNEIVGDPSLGAKIQDEYLNSETNVDEIYTFVEYLDKYYPDIASKVRSLPHESAPPEIVQIKGKQNLAPKDEYLPFVQDFVRNNPLGSGWSYVGDLRNTGLRRVGDKYVTLDELKDMPKTADGFPIGYEPLDDLPEWKDGGIVEFPKITPKAMLNRVISAYNAL